MADGKRLRLDVSPSELRARLFDLSVDLLTVSTYEGYLKEVNPAFERTLGYTRDEVLGRSTIDLGIVFPDDAPRVLEHLARLREGDSAGDLTIRIRGKDGVARWVRWRSAADPDERLLYSAGRDITDRVESEADLRRALSLLNATLESTADGLLVVDLGGKISRFNRRFVDMWRIPEEIIASGNDDDALAYVLEQLREPEAFLEKVRELYAQTEAESYDVLEFKDGRVFERFSRPQRIDGESVGRVWSFRDVTERVAAERSLRRIDAERSEFIASAAHELRAPLTSLAGFATTLAAHREEMSQEQLETAFHRITRNAQRIDTLITNLLDLSQLERERPAFSIDDVCLAPVARRVLSNLQPPEGVVVELAVSEELTVGADVLHLDRILGNLFSNAFKYGGRRVRLEGWETKGSTVIVVADDGPGVSPDLVPRLFEPFTRGLHGDVTGSGLGLAIVRGLVEGFGADISYEPGVPSGARFVVRFPKSH